MKYFFPGIAAILFSGVTFGQSIDQLIGVKEVSRIEQVLSSDAMGGRKAGSATINKAADFISAEFRAAGLQTLEGNAGFKQPFTMVQPLLRTASGSLSGRAINPLAINAVTSLADLQVTPVAGFEKVKIVAGSSFLREANKFVQAKKNYLVLVDTSFTPVFNRLSLLKQSIFTSDKSVVFILTEDDPSEYNISITHSINTIPLANIVGILPGKSLKDEYVIFSAHYDHLGTDRPVSGDSIFNGANDDAAGTTAVIMLAKYFRVLGNNERSIVFAAFTAEESGGFGSQYFSTRFEPTKVAAMFNIEMIGTDSKWGKNSAYITGYEKTDMGKILAKNLTGTGFTFHPDPYPDQQLFYRSDNATLARQGVPAHTISTSKMDNEPFYHTVDDEIGTLDLANMTRIIQAIALSSKSIVAAKDSPTRVNTGDLR